MAREYYTTLEFSPSQLNKVIEIQETILEELKDEPNGSVLAAAFTGASFALSVFSTYYEITAASLGGLMASVLAGLSLSAEHSTIENILEDTNTKLHELKDDVRAAGATSCRIRCCMIEHDNGVRYIFGDDCQLTELCINGIWVS